MKYNQEEKGEVQIANEEGDSAEPVVIKRTVGKHFKNCPTQNSTTSQKWSSFSNAIKEQPIKEVGKRKSHVITEEMGLATKKELFGARLVH